MKTAQWKNLMIVVLITFIAFVTACAAKKTGVAQAEKTTTSMQTVDTDMRQASMQIDAVKATLSDLIKRGQQPAAQAGDVKVAYNTFSDNAGKMNEIGKKLNKDIDTMSAEGNAYFEGWAKEGGTYTDPQIQKLSEERRTRLSSTFRDMQSSTGSVRANLNAYLSDLKQINTYLSNDLTPQGLAAISPVGKSLEQNGNKLKKSFGPVQSAMMEARAQLTPGGAAAGGVSSGQQKPVQQKKATSKE